MRIKHFCGHCSKWRDLPANSNSASYWSGIRNARVNMPKVQNLPLCKLPLGWAANQQKRSLLINGIDIEWGCSGVHKERKTHFDSTEDSKSCWWCPPNLINVVRVWLPCFKCPLVMLACDWLTVRGGGAGIWSAVEVFFIRSTLVLHVRSFGKVFRGLGAGLPRVRNLKTSCEFGWDGFLRKVTEDGGERKAYGFKRG